MNISEAFKELVQPEQRKRHWSVFTHQLVVMILDVMVFSLTLYIGGLIFHITWTSTGLVIGLIGGVLLWAWVLTGGKEESK